MDKQKPPNAQWFVFGAWHKQGRFNKIYYHDDFEWVLSRKTLQQLEREFKK
jgi:hypothetical protein